MSGTKTREETAVVTDLLFCFSQLVTRAVRVIDLITNLDMSAFHSLGGWDKMLARLEMEWKECVHEAPTFLSAEVKPIQDKQAGAEVEEQGTKECWFSIIVGLPAFVFVVCSS